MKDEEDARMPRQGREAAFAKNRSSHSFPFGGPLSSPSAKIRGPMPRLDGERIGRLYSKPARPASGPKDLGRRGEPAESAPRPKGPTFRRVAGATLTAFRA